MTNLVVDASVAFKWLIPDSAEEDVSAAKVLLERHMNGEVKISVPPLLYYEVGNILLFGRSRPPIEEAAQALTDLLSVPLEVIPPTPLDADMTLRLASLQGLTYYDSAYVALAETLDCSLVTADQRLMRRAGSQRVLLLGDLGPAPR